MEQILLNAKSIPIWSFLLDSNQLLFGVAVCIAHKCPFLCLPSKQASCVTLPHLIGNEWRRVLSFNLSKQLTELYSSVSPIHNYKLKSGRKTYWWRKKLYLRDQLCRGRLCCIGGANSELIIFRKHSCLAISLLIS